ncbi:hypothetical protein [Mycolicibacterium confluentis]|uniref:Uncharacterized protein n=1 Tax=Mycolicibacterium confluentis TaxID=28047 RepID=A0A7I7Y0V7_9MYCO|nr:hypothetical protein [Mycolicibacterium confluentis]MCV7320264.1 hypothetical protein [Mycolicibacterium confluentis]ORV34779.1 hypothetical protein AWB99_04130 [Mycolicibacterium confluentis]BBZ35300.1 hypothetical protein MCNF_39050 [Mycolicibacterium confluentis]
MGAMTAAGTLLLLAGTGLAEASKALPDVDGLSWGAAKKVLEDDGFSPSVASTTGDREKWSDCEVTDVREAAQMTGSMNDVTVALNCDMQPTRKG